MKGNLTSTPASEPVLWFHILPLKSAEVSATLRALQVVMPRLQETLPKALPPCTSCLSHLPGSRNHHCLRVHSLTQAQESCCFLERALRRKYLTFYQDPLVAGLPGRTEAVTPVKRWSDVGSLTGAWVTGCQQSGEMWLDAGWYLKSRDSRICWWVRCGEQGTNSLPT